MKNILTAMLESVGTQQGATTHSLSKLMSDLKLQLPREYIDFMMMSNGGEGPIGDRSYISIWPVEEIQALNEAYSVNEFAPGLLLFGSDGGDKAYAFDTRSPDMPIVEVPFVGMDLALSELRATSFNKFIEYLMIN